MIYQDLREFIAEVEKVDTLRHVRGAQTHLEIGGITEVAAGLPECPALLFDDIPGFPARLSHFHQSDEHAATRGTGARDRSRACDRSTRSRPGWRSGEKLNAHKPVFVKEAAFLENSDVGDAVDLGKFPVPVWHREGWRTLYRLGQHRGDARSGHRLDQRVDLSRAGARQEPRHRPVRSSRPARRHHRQEVLGPRQALSDRGRERRGSRVVHRRV